MAVALARPFADPPGDDADGANRAAGLRALAERVAPTALARDRVLPVLPALTGLVGAGLRRGATVTVAGEAGRGATSLAFALVAAATQAGSWAAVAGLPAAHAPAAASLGVALERLALVPDAATLGHWPTVVAALLDGVDLVVAAVPPGLRAPDARRLVARARERGSVLVPLLLPGVSWVEGADVRLRVTAAAWHGLDAGHGFLQAREVEVAATGRGAARRERSVHLWLPGHDGVAVIERVAPPTAAGPLIAPDPPDPSRSATGPNGPKASPPPMAASVDGIARIGWGGLAVGAAVATQADRTDPGTRSHDVVPGPRVRVPGTAAEAGRGAGTAGSALAEPGHDCRAGSDAPGLGAGGEEQAGGSGARQPPVGHRTGWAVARGCPGHDSHGDAAVPAAPGPVADAARALAALVERAGPAAS